MNVEDAPDLYICTGCEEQCITSNTIVFVECRGADWSPLSWPDVKLMVNFNRYLCALIELHTESEDDFEMTEEEEFDELTRMYERQNAV